MSRSADKGMLVRSLISLDLYALLKLSDALFRIDLTLLDLGF